MNEITYVISNISLSANIFPSFLRNVWLFCLLPTKRNLFYVRKQKIPVAFCHREGIWKWSRGDYYNDLCRSFFANTNPTLLKQCGFSILNTFRNQFPPCLKIGNPATKVTGFVLDSGAGEIRTPVQTRNVNAFYMLSFRLDFRGLAGRKLPTHPLASLKVQNPIKALRFLGLLLRSH